jgi:hypothetical protein
MRCADQRRRAARDADGQTQIRSGMTTADEEADERALRTGTRRSPAVCVFVCEGWDCEGLPLRRLQGDLDGRHPRHLRNATTARTAMRWTGEPVAWIRSFLLSHFAPSLSPLLCGSVLPSCPCPAAAHPPTDRPTPPLANCTHTPLAAAALERLPHIANGAVAVARPVCVDLTLVHPPPSIPSH